MFWTRRNRHIAEADLSALLDGELSIARRATVAAHVDGCAACAAVLEQLSQARQMVRGLPREAAPRSFTLTPAMAGARQPASSPQRPRFVFAPAVALSLLVALLAFDLSSGSVSRDAATSSSTADQAQLTKSESSGGVAADSSSQRAASPALSLPSGTPAPAGQAGAAPVAPAAGGLAGAPAIQATAAQPPTTGEGANTTTARDAGADPDAGSFATRSSPEDEQADWLLIAEVVAASAFAVSTVYVFGPRLRKGGR